MPITFKSSGKITEASAKTTNSEHYKNIFSNTNIYKEKAAGEICASSIDTYNTPFPLGPDKSPLSTLPEIPSPKVYKSQYNNGLVGGVLEAYNNHHNLILRPDDIWLAIMSQFAVYVDKNNSVLRDEFVSHQGKILVEAWGVGNKNTADYPALVSTLVNKCEEYIKNDKIHSNDPNINFTVKEWILPHFTTTNKNDRTVGSMIMMSAFQAFFTYKIHLRCGIPNVTLLGEPSDWENIRKRIELLSTYDIGKSKLMTTWKNILVPILDQFITASRGSIDLSFWDRICSHIPGGSGPSYISGWITAFTCFGIEGNWQAKMVTGESWPRIDTNEVNIGFISVPFDLDDNGVEYKAMFFSGHIFHSFVNNNTVQPRLDWIMTLVDEDQIEKATGGCARGLCRSKQAK